MGLGDDRAQAVADIIQDRMEEVFGEDAEAALIWLADDVLGSEERARTLLDGGEVSLSEGERAALADVLSFAADVLAVCLLPTSSEVMAHVVKEALADGGDKCAECCHLREELAQVDRESSELIDIAIATLAHVWEAPDPEVEAEHSRLDEVMRIVASLSPAGQMRVLAACFEEREREAAAEISPRDAIARFREEFLSGSARDLIDTLALADPAGMPEASLVRALAGNDTSALAHALEALTHAAQLFAAVHPGYSRLTSLVHLESGRWRLDPAFHAPLRSLARADQYHSRHEHP